MIRPYVPDDKTALLALLKLNIPRYFDASEENDFSTYLDEHLERYYVVEENGKLIGSGGINFFPAEKLARISWDIVHPEFQGKGIGTELLRHRIARIEKEQGIELIVVRTTQLVYKFYQKAGFELVKTEKDFWAEGFDLYQMEMQVQKA
ncbi:GNAT family N-acetyltransferase [Pontibacter akesuensis]|uniref:N-acetylglutamate synthase, GNAT family n=1 Tax=Pontibacter akesuensis TaxID=388950 RepID=A0A1I7KV77_9BACT|nr:GNAT family N-acetyltransferase [Pontibacter akesuensis]GHA78251.1 acetyltransferase [Pontibacter akesuensis]SFV01351.1 N-acetylglutamate synthase, GNAT family [Pontibacter akesuensis]